MSKFLILGDLHFRKCRSKEENEYRLNVLQFISDYMKLNKISHIIQLGDFFHDRKTVDVKKFRIFSINILTVFLKVLRL